VEFEWDLQKSANNKIKHGIDFEEAATIWEDANLIVLKSKYLEERRFLAIGHIHNKNWTIVFTLRAGKVRIISARRAHDEEVVYYEKNKTNQR